MVLKLKVGPFFQDYFDTSILVHGSTEELINDFLTTANGVDVHVRAKFGVYMNLVDKKIGIYTTVQQLAI